MNTSVMGHTRGWVYKSSTAIIIHKGLKKHLNTKPMLNGQIAGGPCNCSVIYGRGMAIKANTEVTLISR